MSIIGQLLTINIQTLLVFTVVFLLLYNYIIKQSWKRLPPGPPCLPLLGSLPFLGSSDLREPLRKLSGQYGDLFTVYLGQKRVVVLNSYDTIKEALMTHGQAFGDRPPVYFVTELGKRAGNRSL